MDENRYHIFFPYNLSISMSHEHQAILDDREMSYVDVRKN